MTSLKLSLNETVGQAFFSTMTHQLYDFFMYQFVVEQIWHCHNRALLDQYLDQTSQNHLEVGVGTGYWLERTLVGECPPNLTLMDLNQACLDKSARRLAKFSPATLRRNVLYPVTGINTRYDSIGLNLVMHCVEGGMRAKGRAFCHLAECLNDGGVLFGATIVRHGPRHTLPALGFMRVLNWLRIFNNWDDNLEDLKRALRYTFGEVTIDVVGSIALFRCKK